MRKVFVTAFVALLVMLVSCSDFFPVPGADKAEYDEYGQRLINAKVKVGGTTASRALTNALAKGAADYMEVIFKAKGRYYRADGLLTQTLSLKLPAIAYNNTNAILLIGRKTDLRLLAIGTTNTPLALLEKDYTIIFTIKALEADLYAGGTPTFEIDEDKPTTDAGPNPVIKSLKDQNFPENIIKSGTFDDETTTCFQVPINTNGIEATLTIANTVSTIINTSTPTVTFTIKRGGSTNEITAISPSVTFTTSGVITFSFNSKGESSHIITFDVPVVGFEAYVDDNTTLGLVNAKTWHIHGGTITKTPIDFQPTEDSGEAGVALIVTEEPHSMVDINVGPITTTGNPNWL